MNYKHLSQIERYQIHSLMNARHNITQIAQLLGQEKSTISPAGGRRRNQAMRSASATSFFVISGPIDQPTT